WRAGPEDEPDRPGAGGDRQLGVGEAGEAAELDLRDGHASILGALDRGSQPPAGTLDVRGAHQRLADQDRVEARLSQAVELGAGAQAGLGHDRGYRRHAWQQLEGGAEVDLERGEVAVVDADDRRSEPGCGLEL